MENKPLKHIDLIHQLLKANFVRLALTLSLMLHIIT